jgi:cell division protein FtsB
LVRGEKKKEVKESLTSLKAMIPIRMERHHQDEVVNYFFLLAFLAAFLVAFLATFFVAFFLAAIKSPPSEL